MAYTTALDSLHEEIEIMKKIDIPGIIKLYEILDDPLCDKLYLVMPAADCGECLEWNKDRNRFSPNAKVLARRSISKAER
jgi:serine/threonine protein kinase